MAMTPSGYWRPSDGPTAIQDLTEDILKKLYVNHSNSEQRLPTVFSTWTVSWAAMMRYAASLQCESNEIYVSVLDTKKLLQKTDNGNDSVNLVLLTSDPGLFAASGVGHRYRFLVFGVIPGSTFTTKMMADLEQAADMRRVQTLDGSMAGWRMPWVGDRTMLMEKQLQIVQRLGNLFGTSLELAVMCHVAEATLDKFLKMDTGVDKLAERLMGKCSGVPDDWSADPAYSRLDVNRLCARIPGSSVTAMVDKGDVKKAVSIIAAIEAILGGEA
ncbi:hypothetical protein LTR86_004334 [Recurvomyces mirabilis]|nr:hypothetical protein LTR86_004334 [Recurvomyces mirabilis]